MPQSFVNVWIHAVWSTKGRLPVLDKRWRVGLFQIMKTEAEKNKIHLDFVNGIEDHVHILFKLKSTQTIAQIMQQIKGTSSKWINEQGFMIDEEVFSWQDGYGAISVSPDRLTTVRNYIRNQEKHHATKSYEGEIKLFTYYNDA